MAADSANSKRCESSAATTSRDRRYELKARLRPIMAGLRDLEDYVRLDLHDALLADRVRGIHEALTEDVIEGTSYRLSTRWKAKLWDRYCMWRLHNPDAGANARFRFLRSIAGGECAASTRGLTEEMLEVSR